MLPAVSSRAGHRRFPPPAERSLRPRTGRQLLCRRSHPYRNRPRRGNGEEEWPWAALPSPRTMGWPLPAGSLSPSCPEPSPAAAVTARTGQRGELITPTPPRAPAKHPHPPGCHSLVISPEPVTLKVKAVTLPRGVNWG